MAFMDPQEVDRMFGGFTSIETLRLDIPNLTVSGPAIQVLPLAIYV